MQTAVCVQLRDNMGKTNLTLWELSQEEKLVTLHKEGRKNSRESVAGCTEMLGLKCSQ